MAWATDDVETVLVVSGELETANSIGAAIDVCPDNEMLHASDSDICVVVDLTEYCD